MRYHLLILSFVIGFCSCAKADDSLLLQTEDLKSVLYEAVDSGASVKSILLKDTLTQLTLSDGSQYSFNTPVLGSIGLDGYWYVNGEKTNYIWSDTDDSICELLSANQEGGSSLSGIIERIKTWSFYLEDNTVISILKSFYSYDPDSVLRGIAHRGYSVQTPENTLPAFRMAKLRGFNYVETDIRFTSDGIPVLLHDNTVDRTSNGSGNIMDLSLEEVRQMDFGSWKHSAFSGIGIPTFTEFLDLCNAMELSPYVELKAGTQSQIEQLVDYISDYGLIGQASLISFDLNLLRYARDYCPQVRLGYLTNTLSDASINQALTLCNDINSVFVSASSWTAESVGLCKEAGLPLEVWTVDNAVIVLSLPDYVSGVTSNSIHAGMIIHDSHN